ncbi:MAG: YhdP family protein [Pseudomonas sp.]|uniref:YhdP family protein n=1 Tax=Pseudomonas sp. TaxID=306 RepID=UPI00339B215F
MALWLNRLWRWPLRLGILALVLTALYVSLGRELVPWVAEYRAELEQRAGAALGMPLGIGRLEGRWQGLAPEILAHEVQLGEGPDGLRLEQVSLVPDLLGSLLAWQPRIAVLEVRGLQLSLAEDSGGHWALRGLPRRAAAAPVDPALWLARLQQVKRLSLLDSQLTLQAQGQAPLSLTYLELNLSNRLGRHRLDARVLLPDGQPLALNLQARLQPERWRDAVAELYLSLPQSDWARWLPNRLGGAWRTEQLQAGGEFWLSWAKGAVQRGVARVHGPQLQAAYAERPAVALQNLALNAYFRRRAQGFDLLLDGLAFSRDDQRWGEVQVGLVRQDETADVHEQWQVTADRLDLAPLLPLIEALAPLPAELVAALGTLQPHGALRNLKLDYRPRLTGGDRLRFAGNLERLGFSAYHGAPGAENVSGSLSGDLGQGELRLDSEQFVLHLAPIFAKPWQYRRANARLTWRLDEQAFTLISPYLQVEGDEGKIAGDFLIRLLRDPAAEDYMDLRIGLREGDARYTEKYLPEVLSPALRAWLKSAIRGGGVEAGYFQYQGSLNKGAADAARSLSLFFQVADAELAYQPGWPALRAARGEVLIEDSGVRVRVSEGRILGSQVRNARAEIAHVAAGQVPRLVLLADLDSSLPDALKLLLEAPLGTAQLFAGWQGEGALRGALQLDIPLGKGPPPKIQVDFASRNARLQLAEPALQLSELSGAFRFDSVRGLSASDIRAKVFGREVRASALAEGRVGHPRTRIQASGTVAARELANWLGMTGPMPLSGELPYRLGLTLEGLDSQLQVESDLQGLAIELPSPFGKPAGQARPTQWRMSLQGPERRYWLSYAELANLALVTPAGRIADLRGELLLGPGQAQLPGASGLHLRGRLSELDVAAWQAVLAPYALPQTGDAKRLFRGADLRVGRFKGFGLALDNLDLQLARGDGGWALALDSAVAKGQVKLPDRDQAPIDVRLQYLRLPPAEPKPPAALAQVQAEEKPDPLAALDPRQIPALDLRIERLQQGDKLVGAWALKARPSASGVRFTDLDLQLKGLQITGSAGWEGAVGATRSWFQGRLAGGNLADVLLAWDFAPTATSERFRLDVAGQWPGSPAWVSLKRLSGTLDASLRKGQFVEAQGSASALRVFGLLNFNSIGRRLRLDFSDLLGRGISYDRVKGLLAGDNGVFVTREPITLTGPSSNMELNGRLDLAGESIDAKLLVTLPLSNNLPLAALIVGAPAIGGALFVVDKLLGDRVARFASVQYSVKGPLLEPKISFEKPFEKPR